jgi:hypothetical protein
MIGFMAVTLLLHVLQLDSGQKYSNALNFPIYFA